MNQFVSRIDAGEGYEDEGGPSRFFHTSKASKKERKGNDHPTVKPQALCEYLARLILPPQRKTPRRLIVPFSGSGSEMLGALQAGWENGTHRKWCAILDREQFDEFVEHCGLKAESTETMGSIGAPGFGFGWAPAISFNGDHEDCIANAYVTPIPEVERESFDEEDWERVRGAVLSVYG